MSDGVEVPQSDSANETSTPLSLIIELYSSKQSYWFWIDSLFIKHKKSFEE